MKTHIITRNQLDADNNYIGTVDLSNFDGTLVAKENLGTIKFKELKVSGSIIFKAGSGIIAGSGIEAGGRITAREGIKAGASIIAGEGIETGRGVRAGQGIKANWGITADWGIKAGWGITAGEGIEAGTVIVSGRGITAGRRIIARGKIISDRRIIAGHEITAKTISTNGKIFAGYDPFAILEHQEIRAKLLKGTIAHGILIEPTN